MMMMMMTIVVVVINDCGDDDDDDGMWCRSGLATRCRSRLRDEVSLVEFLSYEFEQKCAA